jgi:phosphonate transport system permease protein
VPGLIENTIAGITRCPTCSSGLQLAIGGGDWWWVPSGSSAAPPGQPDRGDHPIAIVATFIGVAVSYPSPFLASTITAPNRPSYLIDKGFINLVRTVPDLFWAMILVTSVGPGALAGTLALVFFSLAVMAKLLWRRWTPSTRAHFEAARHRVAALSCGEAPRSFPRCCPTTCLPFTPSSSTSRASVVLGIVGCRRHRPGAGGAAAFFRFDRVLAVVIIIFVLVFVIEQVSIALRRRLV